MARINIEDSLYRDRRFMQLLIRLRDIDRAVGAIVRAWTVAQTFYTRSDNKMIPYDEWQKSCLPPELIEVGLATIDETQQWVRVAGADEQFAWLLQRVEAGRKGGLAKGKQDQNLDQSVQIQRNGARTILNRAVRDGKLEKPKYCEDCGITGVVIEGHHSDYSKPLAVNWLCKKCHTQTHRNIRQAPASDRLATANDSYPEAKPSSSSSSSSSGSGSDSGAPDDTSPAPRRLRKVTWESYSTAYFFKYKTEPVRNRKVNSQIKALVERLGEEAPDVARFYVGHPKAYYVTKMHDVGSLLADCEALRTQWVTNRTVTGADGRASEKKGTQISLLRAAEDGTL